MAFVSVATNLVAGDVNGLSDIFLRDRDTDADGVLDEAGAVATTRVSVGPGGVESNGPSSGPVLSADARSLLFVSKATNLLAVPLSTTVAQLYRLDLSTGTLTLVSRSALGEPADGDCSEPDVSGDGRFVVFRSLARNLVPGDPGHGGGIFLRDMDTGVLTRLSLPQPPSTGAPPNPGVTYEVVSPSISRDGGTIAFVEASTQLVSGLILRKDGTITIVDRARGSSQRAAADGRRIKLGPDGRSFFALASGLVSGSFQDGWPVHQIAAVGERIPMRAPGTHFGGVSDDGRYAVVGTTSPGIAAHPPVLYDSVTRQVFGFHLNAPDPSLAGDGRSMAFSTDAINNVLPAGEDTNAARDVFVVDLDTFFDQDQDSLDDRAEILYGLSTLVATGDDGPTGDPDHDGRTNAEEVAAGTHPRGLFTRYLAEGATGSFFRTHVAILNPDTDLAHGAGAVFTFTRSDGTIVRTSLVLDPGVRQTLNAATVAGLESADFSVMVESDRPLVLDRTMSWDTRSSTTPSGYGAHTEAAVAAPATQWYLAEGSTVLGFELFYLLQNPQDTPAEATVRFLRPSGPPIVRPYTLAPHSRTTIRVNAVDPALDDSDVSAAIEATAPIIVERSMYATRGHQPFALGHAARGVTAAATNWFLAEGATGDFFDTYVLVANPSASAAEIDVRFDKPDGSSVLRHYTVAGNSRFSIYVDGLPGLEATSASTTVTSTNATPVIVERAMYWPDGFFDYYEGHVSTGTTAPALRWALAEGETGGARQAQSYALIANTSSSPAQVRVTLLSILGAVAQAVYTVSGNSRLTVNTGALVSEGTRFGAVIESIGDAPAPIVVEGSFYWTIDGVLWAAGSNVVATPIP